VRYLLLRGKGFSIAKSRINAHVRWSGSGPVSVGAGAAMNQFCDINHSAPVTIGENVVFGREVAIITGTHEVGGERRRCGLNYAESVTIGDGVWLGARVTVLPGVTIGRGAIVGAGSVVTKSLAPNMVYAGVPAKPVRSLDVPADDEVIVLVPDYAPSAMTYEGAS